MEISANTQVGSSTGVATTDISNQVNTSVLDTETTSSPVAESRVDTENISFQNLLVARQVMTQQVEIALQLSTANSPYQSSSSDTSQSQATTSQYLTQQALHKLGQHHHDAHESEEHSAPIISNVLIMVDQGFSSTSTVLTNMGLMQGQVADEVSQTRDEVVQAVQGQTGQQNPATTNSNNMPDNPDNIDSMSLDSVTAQRTLTTSLELTTREGDVVTINLSRSQSMTADRFSSGGNELLQVSSDREMQFEISIQGDLNAKESQSIRKALEQVTEIAKKMFSGKLESAMERLDEFHINTRQLTSMALNMTSSQSVEATRAYAQISNLGSDLSTQQPAQAQAPVNTPAPTSTVDNTIDQTTTAVASSEPETALSTEPLPSEASAAIVVSTVVQESASIVTEIVDNSNLENPFQQIRQMFSAISSMFHTDNQAMSGSHHRQSIMQLFEGITDNVERKHHHDNEHHESHKHHGYDD